MDNRVVVIIGILAITIIGLLVARKVFLQKHIEPEILSGDLDQDISPSLVSPLSARS